MTPELQKLIAEQWPALWPMISKLLLFIGAARFLVKPFGLWLQRKITRAAEVASLSLDKDDDTIIEHALRSRPYKFFAFCLDWLASVKLPAADDLFKHT